MNGAQPLPGGQIWGDGHWFVDHCVGPLGLGALVVLPVRHVLHLAELTSEEVSHLGGILHAAAQVATDLMAPEQVYVSLLSHADGRPGHIHFVVQPVTRQTMDHHGGLYGPRLQAQMFAAAEPEQPADVEAIAEIARTRFDAILGPATWHGPFANRAGR